MSDVLTNRRHIVAIGGADFLAQDGALLDKVILPLTGKDRPRVCFLPTASADSEVMILRFYSAFHADRCRATFLTLFNRSVEDIRELLLSQDVIYVGGGNTANMLAVWRVQGVADVLREAWDAGIVLCGVSAGGLCWFEGGVTDSFGPRLAALNDGLGFLSGTFCPHYDGEPSRRPTYQRLVGEGMPAGYALDDGVALHYVGTDLVEVVSSRPTARAYRVEKRGGEVVETPLEPRLLD